MKIGMSRSSVCENIFKELKDAGVKYFEVSLYKEAVENIDKALEKDLSSDDQSIVDKATQDLIDAKTELENNKYLIRKRQKNALGQFEYEYIVYEVPHTENTHADNQHAANVHAENRRQISKEEKSIKELNINRVSKEKEKEEIDSLLQEVGNTDLIELYWDYIDMRKGMDAPLNPRSLKTLITRCERLSNNNVRVQKVLLENAIINGWKNVFLPKESELKHINADTQKDIKALLGIDD